METDNIVSVISTNKNKYLIEQNNQLSKNTVYL